VKEPLQHRGERYRHQSKQSHPGERISESDVKTDAMSKHQTGRMRQVQRVADGSQEQHGPRREQGEWRFSDAADQTSGGQHLHMTGNGERNENVG